MKRLLALTLAISLILSSSSFAAGWKQDDKGWWYENDDGSYKLNEWFNDPATGWRYHANTFGYIDTGLTKINDQWYHFSDTGELYYNIYDREKGIMSDGDGKAYLPTENGYLGGQVVLYYNDMLNGLGLGIVNCRNIGLIFDGYAELSGNGIYETWYEYDFNEQGYMGKPVTVAPGDTKFIFLSTEDGHPINFPGGKYKLKAHYHLEDGSDYWIQTNVLNGDGDEWLNELYFSHH